MQAIETKDVIVEPVDDLDDNREDIEDDDKDGTNNNVKNLRATQKGGVSKVEVSVPGQKKKSKKKKKNKDEAAAPVNKNAFLDLLFSFVGVSS